MTTDNTPDKELDKILRSLAHQAYLTAHAPGYTKLDGRTYKTAVDEAKQAILDWHDKQVEGARLNEVQNAYEYWINGRKFMSSYLRARISELTSKESE